MSHDSDSLDAITAFKNEAPASKRRGRPLWLPSRGPYPGELDAQDVQDVLQELEHEPELLAVIGAGSRDGEIVS